MERAAHVSVNSRATWPKEQRGIKYLSRNQRRESIRYIYPAENKRWGGVSTVELWVAMGSRPTETGRLCPECIAIRPFVSGPSVYPSLGRRTHLERSPRCR